VNTPPIRTIPLTCHLYLECRAAEPDNLYSWNKKRSRPRNHPAGLASTPTGNTIHFHHVTQILQKQPLSGQIRTFGNTGTLIVDTYSIRDTADIRLAGYPAFFISGWIPDLTCRINYRRYNHIAGLWIRIRIQWLCGSGSVLGIRIRIQGQENEDISVEKCTF
jgi:hypothetical protein